MKTAVTRYRHPNTIHNSISRRRDPRSGTTLIPTLLAVVTIAGTLAVYQARELSQVRSLAALVHHHQTDMDRRAVLALSTGDLARAIISPEEPRGPVRKLDGTPFPVTYRGNVFDVSFQDVEGLLDIYLTPFSVLRAAGVDAASIVAARDRIAETLPNGRYPDIRQSLAVFEVDPAHSNLFTQSADRPGLRVENTPDALKAATVGLPSLLDLSGQAKLVRVKVERR